MPSALFYVGCVNRPIGYVKKVAGKGISAYRLDLDTGATQFLGLTEGIDNPTFVEALQDVWVLVEILQRPFDGRLPFDVRRVRPEHDAPAAPGSLVEATDLQNQVTLLLAEVLELFP